MGKKIYLTIIWCLALLAVIFGLGIHVFDWFRAEKKVDDDVYDIDADEISEELNSDKLTDNVKVDAFTNVDIEAGVLHYEIQRSSDDTYSVYYEASSKKLIPETIKSEGGKLRIEGDDADGASVKDYNNLSLDIIIYIPQGVDLETVSVAAGAGEINLKDVNVKKLVLKLGAGDVDVKNIPAEDMRIEAGAGDVDVSGIGKVDEYSLDVSLGLGEVTVDGSKKSGIVGDYETTGTTDKKLKIDCGMGDVDISE